MEFPYFESTAQALETVTSKCTFVFSTLKSIAQRDCAPTGNLHLHALSESQQLFVHDFHLLSLSQDRFPPDQEDVWSEKERWLVWVRISGNGNIL